MVDGAASEAGVSISVEGEEVEGTFEVKSTTAGGLLAEYEHEGVEEEEGEGEGVIAIDLRDLERARMERDMVQAVGRQTKGKGEGVVEL